MNMDVLKCMEKIPAVPPARIPIRCRSDGATALLLWRGYKDFAPTECLSRFCRQAAQDHSPGFSPG